MENNPILEACVDTVEQAILAEKNGANRIELCANLSVGGLTPSKYLLLKTKAAVNLPIMAMARPRSGNFIYSNKEIEAIKASIDLFKSLNLKGVVFGFLNDQNEIDLPLTREMVTYAKPLDVTFHKAIDLTIDPVLAARKIASIKGIQRILTSGGKKTAEEGKTILKEMQKSVGEKTIILVAGKVTKYNINQLHHAIGAKEYHGRRIVN